MTIIPVEQVKHVERYTEGEPCRAVAPLDGLECGRRPGHEGPHVAYALDEEGEIIADQAWEE